MSETQKTQEPQEAVLECTSAIVVRISPEPLMLRMWRYGLEKPLKDRGVVVSRDYKFMCSSLGQELIENDIQELGSEPGGCGSVFAPPAREHIPHSMLQSRIESLHVRVGLDT